MNYWSIQFCWNSKNASWDLNKGVVLLNLRCSSTFCGNVLGEGEWEVKKEDPESPDNIDFNSWWCELVELSVAEASLLTEHSHLSVLPFLALLLIVNHKASALKAWPFTLAFKWPFAPFLPPFKKNVSKKYVLPKRSRCCVFEFICSGKIWAQSLCLWCYRSWGELVER